MRAVGQQLIVVVGTSSGFASIPAALHAVRLELRRDLVSSKQVIPVGMNIYLQGGVFYYFTRPPCPPPRSTAARRRRRNIMTPIAGIFAAIASLDAPGIAAMGMVSIILEPLAIPVGVTVNLLTVIDPIIDPIVATADVHGNCASAVMSTDEQGPRTLDT